MNYLTKQDVNFNFIITRQSVFVKHVPPLWAYFIEATKLEDKHFKSLNSCNI